MNSKWLHIVKFHLQIKLIQKMSLPEKLKSLLENDHRMIEEELKLPRLPARSSVSKILKEVSLVTLFLNCDLLPLSA